MSGIAITQTLLAVLFAVALLCAIILSAVLFFHWKRFGRKARGIVIMEGLYIVVSAVLILSAGAALLSF
ncbi:MAG: hypothetical protein Q7R88_02525 [bacterium]|nr:hypothetical protein [bacterium]